MIMLNRTRGPRNSVIRSGTDGWWTAVVEFKARSTRAVGSPNSCSKVDTSEKKKRRGLASYER